MKKIITGILFLFFATSLFSQYDNTIKWQSSSIKIDGNTADWKSRPHFYDNNTKLTFDLRNDSNNLYMVLQFFEQETQFKIARGGMRINFETKIKPKRKASIMFSPFIKEKHGTHDKNNSDKKETSIIKQKYLLMPPDVQGSGFAYSNENLSVDNNSNNIIYFVDWDSLKTMSIEIKIPLRELFGDGYNLKIISLKEISMTFKENALENPGLPGGETSSGMGQGLGEEGMANSGGRGFNNGGNITSGIGDSEHQYGSGGTQITMPMFESQTFKYKFKLNSNIK